MKKRFSVMDAVIIVAVIAVVFVGLSVLSIVNLNKVTDAGKETKEISLVVELTNMDDRLKDELMAAVGEEVSISNNDDSFGKIAGVTYRRAKMTTFDMINGQYLLQERTKNWDVYVTIDATAVDSDRAVTVGETEVKVGAKAFVKTKNVGPSGFVLSVDEKN